MKPWFKLYGLEFLSDPKIQRLTAQERSCWVTLLCLASMDEGIVKNVSEEYIMERSGIDPMDDEWNKTRGILVKFELLGFIQIQGQSIFIKNWSKRQEVYSESRDRVQRWREKQRLNSDVTPVTLPSNSKSRIEENRIDMDAERVVVEEKTPQKKVTPQMQQVFDLFQGNPARLVWKTRVHEREAAKVLFDSYGIEELQKRYKATRKHKDDPMCPQVDSPADFLEKMPKMERFLKTV